MPDILIRTAEGCDPDPFLLWDTVWDTAEGRADWAYAKTSETLNVGGLQATQSLPTAVTILLFTDLRIDPTHPLYFLADGDPRGWWGDGVDVRGDLDEQPLGSYLWLLERAPMTINGLGVDVWAKQFAEEALAPLLTQGAVVRIDVAATAIQAESRLELVINLFGRDGNNIYDRKFDLVWQQVGS